MTQPEQSLWALLRRNQLSVRFRRQHPLGPYVLDFYCASAKLAIEVDGQGHGDDLKHDERRTDWLRGEGIRVLRLTSAEIENRPASVLAAIAQAAPPSTA